MAENKTKPTNVSVSAFIESLADDTRRADARSLVKLMESATGEKAKMWGSSIIGYGSYHYKYDTGREGDMPLAGFSPRKAATVVYNMGAFGESDPLRAKLGKHKIDGSCLHIKKLADIDQSVLKTMITKSVAAKRAQESKH